MTVCVISRYRKRIRPWRRRNKN